MATKKFYHHGNLRDELVVAAGTMLSTEDPRKLTLRELSRRLGVSRAAPYRHFANKEAILLAVAENGFRQLTARYRAINSDEALDARSRFQRFGLAYVGFAIGNAGPYRLMFGPEITRQRGGATSVRAAARETFQELLQAMRTLTESGGARPDRAVGPDRSVALANLVWSSVHGLAMLLIDGQVQLARGTIDLPTLLGGDNTKPMTESEDMLAFAKETIDGLWRVMRLSEDRQRWDF